MTGYGVTVAILDTGHSAYNSQERNTANEYRLLAHHDAIDDKTLRKESDDHGHGSHVSAIVVNSAANGLDGRFNGIAPDAELVVVKAFDDQGQATYSDVIRGIDWIVANKDTYGIRVLNLSFSAPPKSYYWDDPLNQAVMAAWQSGIVVAASAGNLGPDPMTIGVPGNVPYVITVGAMTDNLSPGDGSDDLLASFSSAGPTVEASVKPEVVAPGGHLLAMMASDVALALQHPEFHDAGEYFVMSGTSQAAAVVSGAATLMLQTDPSLSPDDVKCRLLSITAFCCRSLSPKSSPLCSRVLSLMAPVSHSRDFSSLESVDARTAGALSYLLRLLVLTTLPLLQPGGYKLVRVNGRHSLRRCAPRRVGLLLHSSRPPGSDATTWTRLAPISRHWLTIGQCFPMAQPHLVEPFAEAQHCQRHRDSEKDGQSSRTRQQFRKPGASQHNAAHQLYEMR